MGRVVAAGVIAKLSPFARLYFLIYRWQQMIGTKKIAITAGCFDCFGI